MKERERDRENEQESTKERIRERKQERKREGKKDQVVQYSELLQEPEDRVPDPHHKVGGQKRLHRRSQFFVS